jgi:hypothetical protein
MEGPIKKMDSRVKPVPSLMTSVENTPNNFPFVVYILYTQLFYILSLDKFTHKDQCVTITD